MILRNKILKISLILLSFILLISTLLVILFIFKKPKWEEVYENDTVEYLNENMFKLSEEKLIATLWAYEILPFDEDIIVGFNSPDGDVKLYLDQEKISLQEEIDFVDTEYGTYAPVFLSVEIKKDKGTILDQFKCLFGKEDKCITKIDILNVQIYENRYPYPTLTEEQSKEFALDNINKYGKDDYGIDTVERKCLNLMSEYVVNIEDREKILDKLSEITCSDISTSLLYANLVEKDDAFYTQIKERACEGITQLEQSDAEILFSPTAIRIYNEMCNTSYIVPEDRQESLDENTYQTSRDILHLLNNRENEEYDKRIGEIKELLTSDLFTSFTSPSCFHMYICNPELINLSKVIFND